MGSQRWHPHPFESHLVCGMCAHRAAAMEGMPAAEQGNTNRTLQQSSTGAGRRPTRWPVGGVASRASGSGIGRILDLGLFRRAPGGSHRVPGLAQATLRHVAGGPAAPAGCAHTLLQLQASRRRRDDPLACPQQAAAGVETLAGRGGFREAQKPVVASVEAPHTAWTRHGSPLPPQPPGAARPVHRERCRRQARAPRALPPPLPTPCPACPACRATQLSRRGCPAMPGSHELRAA